MINCTELFWNNELYWRAFLNEWISKKIILLHSTSVRQYTKLYWANSNFGRAYIEDLFQNMYWFPIEIHLSGNLYVQNIE